MSSSGMVSQGKSTPHSIGLHTCICSGHASASLFSLTSLWLKSHLQGQSKAFAEPGLHPDPESLHRSSTPKAPLGLFRLPYTASFKNTRMNAKYSHEYIASSVEACLKQHFARAAPALTEWLTSHASPPQQQPMPHAPFISPWLQSASSSLTFFAFLAAFRASASLGCCSLLLLTLWRPP